MASAENELIGSIVNSQLLAFFPRNHSPALKSAHGSEGRLCKISFIQSNCGCAVRYFPASKLLPHAEPQRAAKLNFFAIVASTTLASTVPAQPNGTPGHEPAGSRSNSKWPHN